jgi:uncharacterized damage-inducible protein DinB
MSSSIQTILEPLTIARSHFLKHIKDLKEDQWDFKPFPNTMTIRDTLRHLVIDDLSALDSLQTGAHPDYDSFTVEDETVEALLERMTSARQALIDELTSKIEESGEAIQICTWGEMRPLHVGVAYLTSEDYYHTGQVGFLRQASDPDWDYYASVYG